MFIQLKQAIQDQFNLMIKDQTKLFTVNPDRERIWDYYLSGFDESVKQHHNCNCCKSFLRQFSGIVSIKNGQKVSMWDNIIVPDEYLMSILNVQNYIKGLPITDIFLNDYANLGTDKNLDNSGEVPILWNHFHVKLPQTFVHKGSTSIESIQGIARDNKNVLQRSLEEFSQDSIETILELISQNSLYRGKEFEGMLIEFLKVKKAYETSGVNKDIFCWSKSVELSQGLCRIRNTSIGTLLVNLNEGMELDAAVTAFERVVAPSNYKRPTAVTTPKMVEEAKKRLLELGLMDSLERRFANQTDVPIEEILFTDRSSNATDVFSEMSKDSPVNPKTLSKVEEITMEKFIADVLPNSKGLEVLLENGHLNNMVSLLTSVNSDSPSMFKWNNPFSWSYTGGITDSMKARVAELGGRVDGVFRFTHSWNEIEPNQSLMDLHVFMPGNNHAMKSNISDGYGVGRRVGWNQRKDYESGGVQDVDYTNPAPAGYIPIENITFPSISKMPEGKYICKIHNWNFRSTGGRGKAEIEVGGNLYQYEYPKTKHKEWVTIAEVTLKDGIFTIDHKLPESNSSRTKWSLNTNRFHKVKTMMLSPNHWQQQTGNKHYLFFLENCISDESPRPFFNEFLKEELLKEKRVFETLAGKLKVEPSQNQLSGIGFSETQPNHLYVRVEGNFKRILKIKI